MLNNYYCHDLSPFAWEFAEGVGFRWYGLAYVAGFIAGYFMMRRWQREGWLPLLLERVSDFLTWAIVGILAGGRLGYALFYDLQHTLRDPLSLFRVWEGGMASHGGILGLIAAAWLFGRREGVTPWRLADALSLAATPGIFLGRIANFINGELWGRPTTVPWAVVFPASPTPFVPRHPSQIYEALLEGLFLGLVLLAVKKRTVLPGAVFCALLVAYPLVRILGEFFREPDAHIGYLWFGWTEGQWLSAGMIIAGIVTWILRAQCKNKLNDTQS